MASLLTHEPEQSEQLGQKGLRAADSSPTAAAVSLFIALCTGAT